jgi:hypothetical protein
VWPVDGSSWASRLGKSWETGKEREGGKKEGKGSGGWDGAQSGEVTQVPLAGGQRRALHNRLRCGLGLVLK